MAQLLDKQHASIADLAPELDRLAVDAMADWTLCQILALDKLLTA